MIALILMLAQTPVAPADATMLGSIGQQALPAKGCAAYLWTADGNRRLVAMASVEPAQLRLSIDGRTVDVARVTQSGTGGYGFGDVTAYTGGDIAATLDMQIETRADMTAGAAAQGSLRIDRPGRDTVILPVAGLIGCTT